MAGDIFESYVLLQLRWENILNKRLGTCIVAFYFDNFISFCPFIIFVNKKKKIVLLDKYSDLARTIYQII